MINIIEKSKGVFIIYTHKLLSSSESIKHGYKLAKQIKRILTIYLDCDCEIINYTSDIYVTTSDEFITRNVIYKLLRYHLNLEGFVYKHIFLKNSNNQILCCCDALGLTLIFNLYSEDTEDFVELLCIKLDNMNICYDVYPQYTIPHQGPDGRVRVELWSEEKEITDVLIDALNMK